MLKRHWLLGLVVVLGLGAVEACSDSDAPAPSASAGNAGSAGKSDNSGGRSGSAGQGGAAASAGATHTSAGQAGESTDDAGAGGSAGSSDDAGANSGGTGGTAGTGGNAGHAGTAGNGGTAGTGGTAGSGGSGGTSGAGAGGTAGTGGSAGGTSNTFTLQTTTLGKVIATTNGLTLYAFKADTAAVGQTPPTSACTGGCLTTWPLYYASTTGLPAGLSAADFGSFDRGNGVLQSTYKGWPLYTYANDAAAGNVNGEGIGTKWYSVKLPFTTPGATTFTLQATATLGNVIATDGGLTLYVLKTDTAGAAPVSTCSGGCLGTWPLYYAAQISVPSGLLAADFGSFDRGGGVLQSTYKGWPLYTFAGDGAAGAVNGEGIGSVWYSAKSPFVAP